MECLHLREHFYSIIYLLAYTKAAKYVQFERHTGKHIEVVVEKETHRTFTQNTPPK